jgi:hypothetical protein
VKLLLYPAKFINLPLFFIFLNYFFEGYKLTLKRNAILYSSNHLFFISNLYNSTIGFAGLYVGPTYLMVNFKKDTHEDG